jgi:hypothetical protein
MSLARTSQSAVSRVPVTPSTPQTPAAQADQPYTPGGSWKHPKFDEIARRQYATTFDERNVRAIVANAGLLFLSVYGNSVTSKVKLLEYAAYVPLLHDIINFPANTFQHPNQYRRQSRALQRMGNSPRPPRFRRQHHLRVPTPRAPLLPGRHRRHTSYALAARVHGSQGRLDITANTRLCIRVAQLRHTAPIPALHTAQRQLQQPGSQLAVAFVGQSARRLRAVDVQLAVLAEHEHG